MTVPVPVGRLLCQRNAFLRTCTATVVSATPSKTPKRVDVVLSDTILFPTGGGQPHDVGRIGGRVVVEVLRKGLECVHVVEEGEGVLSVGEEVAVELDWERRWDHMQQHSGQHLLSALAEQQYNLNTVGWGLGQDKCYVELDLTKRPPPTSEELASLESKVNEVIRSALPFQVKEEEPEDRPDSMPTDLRDVGVVRFVSIGKLDRNPCCGTHVSTTADLQCLKLLHTEKVRGKNIRLFFLFGDRVMASFQQSLLRERAIGSILSTGPEKHVEKLTHLTKQLKDSNRTTKSLTKDLTHLLSTKLSTHPSPPTHPILHHRDDADVEFLQTLIRSLSDLPGGLSRVYILSCGESVGAIMVVGPAESAMRVWGLVVEAFEGDVKGGGKAGRFQGKAGSWRNRGKVVEAVGAIVV
ncbi:Alanyl-tRNA editing protein Aarsd1 [Dinochytrium kinnereticum]|nr:Alanyl-tRNA editing protein Aarsd1 [Dinochytrium kinnereticum]